LGFHSLPQNRWQSPYRDLSVLERRALELFFVNWAFHLRSALPT
jgi:hypothetical protein